MSTTATTAAIGKGLDPNVLTRILNEGYGPGAWHGPDLKAALAGLTPEQAFWRPAPGRHNIAEIALHHAWCVHSVRQKLSAAPPEPFALDGEDWFTLPEESKMTWPEILRVVETQQEQLAAALSPATGRRRSALPDSERFDLALGVTCHAIYHAGQTQLLRRLREQQR
ncbi:MAG: DinB family protein [Bryobacteraceae bacterium]|nr:DinB family protein [Bryobacteraceae bacterium]